MLILTAASTIWGTTKYNLRIYYIFDTDYQFKFHLHTTEIAIKANQLLVLITKSFDYLDSDDYLQLLYIQHLNTVMQHQGFLTLKSAWTFYLRNAFYFELIQNEFGLKRYNQQTLNKSLFIGLQEEG